MNLHHTLQSPVTADRPQQDSLFPNIPKQNLFMFLLIYRWGSLLLAMWLFIAKTELLVGVSLSFLLAFALAGTLFITIFHTPLKQMLLDTPLLIGFDLLFVATLLTLSGGPQSPFTFYALSPLLASAFFFQMRGAIISLGVSSLIYPLILWLSLQRFGAAFDIAQLFTQVAGFWLVTVLFGSLSDLVKQLQQTHQALTETHASLARQNDELITTHHQLELIHELSLFLYAPDKQTIQQKLLNVVVKTLEFDRAAIALFNSNLSRLEKWHFYPLWHPELAEAEPLYLSADEGILAQSALQQQVRWTTPNEKITENEWFSFHLGTSSWLSLPMRWQEQTVGVLLISVPESGPVDKNDDRWPILTSLVSQAAVALGTINHTQQLAVEQERNRIARDIHDTVAQSLFGIVFTLDACTKLLPKQAEVVKTELIELKQVADMMRQQVRQSIMNLWPTELTEVRFREDLEKYVINCAPAHVFHVDFAINGDFEGLPVGIRRALYRVCQEALANAARHAGVDTARIYLYVEPHEINLSIRDKGKGFEPKIAMAREQNREHFGLRGMRERVETLGGSCDILSQIDQGTQVLIRIPVNGGNEHGQ